MNKNQILEELLKTIQEEKLKSIKIQSYEISAGLRNVEKMIECELERIDEFPETDFTFTSPEDFEYMMRQAKSIMSVTEYNNLLKTLENPIKEKDG